MILNLLLLLTLACKSEDKLVGNYLPTGPQTYFFDSVNGSDNNDGLTKANAFKSLDKLDNITTIKVYVAACRISRIVGITE